MERQLRSSTSSLYVTGEEVERMEVVMKEIVGQKRRLSGRHVEGSIETGEESEEIERREEKRGRREEESMSQAMRILVNKVSESEKCKAVVEEEEDVRVRALAEQRKVREESGKRGGNTEVIERVQQATRTIMEAVEKENGGKISFTRGDQLAIRKAVWQVQNEMLELMERMMEAEEKTRQAEE